MGTKVVLIKELLLIIGRILFQEMLNSLLRSMTAHIFDKISVNFMLEFLLLRIGYKDPGQYRVLGNIEKISACDIIEPLNILKVTHLFINPFEGLLRL